MQSAKKAGTDPADFPWQNCIVSSEVFSEPRSSVSPASRRVVRYIVFSLKDFAEAMGLQGMEKTAARCLTVREREYWDRLHAVKRQREWLGGRLAAKYVASLMQTGEGCFLPWSEFAILADENGRPFLAAAKTGARLPDISISHSGDMAAALAVGTGLCGIDIQKVTERTVRVRERFCLPVEEQILETFFPIHLQSRSVLLTKLWAAKEAIRKTANLSSLPGFLELELTEIKEGSPGADPACWTFFFRWRKTGKKSPAIDENCSVSVKIMADYVLAFSTRNDNSFTKSMNPCTADS